VFRTSQYLALFRWEAGEGEGTSEYKQDSGDQDEQWSSKIWKVLALPNPYLGLYFHQMSIPSL
jgi:hypothetical protein